ncbi:hypothetical protein DEA8626_01112 [Defluviimonas aquaemixtae]|uniref:DUF1223 domain-containing protein n=1 Tax=Albidovulum aquaemixtae TaxID=1542388 RepID=A0A2R8B4S2_9RHOB|nr:DUF1223 domain-containing protein [Defluviimonas aquaemixtae]SPH17589.1 hypothetical protein DEA8626_01112 [Defluviimonas aquaemixtae]
MLRIFGAALGVWLGVASFALAQSGTDSPVVVELYTSQGCSSCPPADAILKGLAAREDVIALGLHVDYWDYIGWKDNFADPAFSKRQRAYARAAGARSVYTPQMIVGGREHLVGSRVAELDRLLRRYAGQKSNIALSIARKGDGVRLTARANGGLPGAAIVQLVRYRPMSRVEIRRGENAGRVLDYANVVTTWARVAEWDGRSDLSLDVAAEGPEPVVVIIQQAGPGPILAAARLR